MYITLKNKLASLIVLLTFISVNQWSDFPIGNTYLNWLLCFIILFLLINGTKYYYDIRNSKKLVFLNLYLFWIVISIFRGIFEAEYYWDYKNLVHSSLGLLVAVSIYCFTNPNVIQIILSKWLYYALPFFSIFFFFLTADSYGYYLIPITFFALFLPFLSPRWKVVVFLISLFVVFVDIDARSNVIKFLVPVFLSFLFYYKRFVKFKLLKVLFLTCFAMPFILLFLAIFNVFNVFQMEEYIKGDYSKKTVVSGQLKVSDLKADTRTGIYREVLISAIKNNYILLGRTPARGNDSEAFGLNLAETLHTGRYERYGNEVSILNIFTWTGIIGVVLYFLIFLKAVYLAIYKSKSFFLKIIGLYVMFRWIYSWVEDFNRFDIMNIVLFIFIAICYSEQFRSMNDKDFKNWLKSIFDRNNKLKSWKSE